MKVYQSEQEMISALSGAVEVRPFDPWEAADTQYPITTFQPLLWEVPSIAAAFSRMSEYLSGR